MIEFYAEADFTLASQAAERAFAELLGDPRLGGVWIAEYDSVPAGYVVVTVSFSMEYGGLQGCIDDLFVRQEYRGNGLASAALAEVRRSCEGRGIRALHVEIGMEDEPARRVYGRNGFEESGRRLLTLGLAPPLHLA